MTKRNSALPFARGLFDAALASGDARRVGDELQSVAGLLARHAELHKALANPAVSSAARKAIAAGIADAAGLSPVTRAFLAIVVDQRAVALLPDIARRYRARVMQHFRLVEAEVTTAVPVGDGPVAAVTRRLAEMTGKEVTVTTRVDPSIIGGVVTRIGSTVFDGSVRRQLERLKSHLSESGQ
jgi:F-type H+-transporting ATPase subunit delta